MKLICKRCSSKEEFDIPELSTQEKQELWKQKIKSSLYAVKHLLDKNMVSHKNAKFMISHINLEYRQCNRCNFNQLEGEYVTCPTCKSLNFNWKV